MAENDAQEVLQNHEERIQGLEKHRDDTIRLLGENDRRSEDRLREVKQGLERQIERLERDARERDSENAKRLDRVEAKLDQFSEKLDKVLQSFSKAIRQTPPWVWPLISAILAVGGWLLGTRG